MFSVRPVATASFITPQAFRKPALIASRSLLRRFCSYSTTTSISEILFCSLYAFHPANESKKNAINDEELAKLRIPQLNRRALKSVQKVTLKGYFLLSPEVLIFNFQPLCHYEIRP